MKIYELKIENEEEEIVYRDELYQNRSDAEIIALGEAMNDIRYSLEGDSVEEAKSGAKFYCDEIARRIEENPDHPYESFSYVVLCVARDNTGISYKIIEKEVKQNAE